MTQDTTRPRAPAPLPPLLRDLWRLLRRPSPGHAPGVLLRSPARPGAMFVGVPAA